MKIEYVKEIICKKGELLKANNQGSEFNLTYDKKYEILDVCGDLVLITNDLGNEEWYCIGCFK